MLLYCIIPLFCFLYVVRTIIWWILLSVLLPDDPNVTVGHSLQMTCQLHSDEYHAKDLKFEFWLSYPSRRRIRVPASYVRPVNASVVKLNYTNMRPRFDRATVSCYLRNRPSLRDMQIIKVGREWILFTVCASLLVQCVSFTDSLFCGLDVIL